MKVLFEVPLHIADNRMSQFSWLRSKMNRLFVIEEGRKMRTISTTDEVGKELHSATLTEAKTCTALAWNKDSSLLALVVDRRKIYIWDLETGNFLHYRQNIIKNLSNPSNNLIGKKVKQKDVELLAWSKISNKLVISLSNGQLILSKFDSKNLSTPDEKLVDNSDGVSKAVTSIECSEELDLFVCITIISEVLVMTFDGELKFYIQNEDLNIIKAKLSPVHRDKFTHNDYSDSNSLIEIENVWLTYQTKADKLLFKNIRVNSKDDQLDSTNIDLFHEDEDTSTKPLSSLVEFYWLSGRHIVLCYSSGVIRMLETKTNTTQERLKFGLKSELILDLSEEIQLREGDTKGNIFKSFKLVLDVIDAKFSNNISTMEEERSFSLAATTDYQLFYYKLLEASCFTKAYSCEKVDDLDLKEGLKKINSKLTEVEWSYDCSMLALQITNGHILVYRTRLQNYMVVSSYSRTAYLSGLNEITILNYKPDLYDTATNESETKSDGKESPIYGSGANALTVQLDMRPSLIAIGPKHLAVALNNRVRFYHVSSSAETNTTWLSHNQEYLSNVVKMSLCSNFVAVLFDDERLKLHTIHSNPHNNRTEDRGTKSNYSHYTDKSGDQIFDERFFPDPSKPEHIASFTLTEELLVYSTSVYQLNVFSLISWTIVQTLDYGERTQFRISRLPFMMLKANEKGNKFACLTRESSVNTPNVFLYDLYSNTLVEPFNQSLFNKIYNGQLKICHDISNLAIYPHSVDRDKRIELPKMSRIKDAIWDVDGKTLLLIERKCIHNCLVIDHTLERESTTVEYVSTLPKAFSHTTLYASHGIISFQTDLGRVINLISETYDDDLKLTELRQQIQKVYSGSEGVETNESRTVEYIQPEIDQKVALYEEAQVEVIKLKVDYLKTALALYSLSKSKEICEYLLHDEQFNYGANEQKKNSKHDDILWRLLACWALYTLNLNFALMIYRKHGFLVEARVLAEILDDAHKFGMDSRVSVRNRLLILLGCESAENDDEDEDEDFRSVR